MNDEINTNANDTQPTNSTQEASGDQGGKLFTQDDVNRIVSERLAREREKLNQQPQKDARETALKAREEAVAAREARYQCEDYLAELHISDRFKADLLAALGTSDFARFKAGMDLLAQYFEVKTTTSASHSPVNPPKNSTGDTLDAKIADAFKPKI